MIKFIQTKKYTKHYLFKNVLRYKQLGGTRLHGARTRAKEQQRITRHVQRAACTHLAVSTAIRIPRAHRWERWGGNIVLCPSGAGKGPCNLVGRGVHRCFPILSHIFIIYLRFITQTVLALRGSYFSCNFAYFHFIFQCCILCNFAYFATLQFCNFCICCNCCNTILYYIIL